MGGGLLQLVANGSQDVYLTGNPQITFFKVVYRRHTNFSIEPCEQNWNAMGDFGRNLTCTLNRTGDLIHTMHVVINLPAVDASSSLYWGYVGRLGHALISETKVEIGGQIIDEQYGDWLNIWYELTVPGQKVSYSKMIGDVVEMTNIDNLGKPNYILYIPLKFWFNVQSGLALPIIALQYHDIRVSVQLNTWNNCVNYMGSTPPPTQKITDCFLLIDYIYLDSDERKKFSQMAHEYLIEQLQWYNSEIITGMYNKYKLNFNHPCKYVVWAPHLERYNNRTNWLAHANQTNGLWSQAKDLFAKLMAIACSGPVAGVVPTTSPTITNTTILLPIEFLTPATQATLTLGEIVELNKLESGGFTTEMLSKITIQWIVDMIVYDISGNPSQVYFSLDNAIILINNLSIQDISQPISILIGSTTNPASTTAEMVMNSYGVSIINTMNYGNMIDGTDNPVYSAKIQLNGHDRFQPLDGNYFNYVQAYQHFSNTPSDGINVFSFALKPEEYQPTGTCNFSRIDNAVLEIDLGLYNQPTDQTTYIPYIGTSFGSLLNIYAKNYNVLRIVSGMAGLAYNA
jgi:hypothetical protein